MLDRMLVVVAASAAASAAMCSYGAGAEEVFAHLEGRFLRSVAMRCREFHVTIGTDGRHHMEDYVVDFTSTPPASGLALYGALRRTQTDLDFEISGVSGPWTAYTGIEPTLRRLTIRREPSADERVFRCLGLSLHDKQESRGAREVSVTLDTARAYNWIRFPGYLEWTRHFLATIESHMERTAASQRKPLVVDVGGGSGWMSMLLKAQLLNRCQVLCTDIAVEALELAAVDAKANQLDIQTAVGDMFEPLLKPGMQRPSFMFFNPPQIIVEDKQADNWRGSPDVSLLAPRSDATFFHTRFCREGGEVLAPRGVAWLGVNWDLLQKVIEVCCGAGWSVTLPAAARDLVTAPSALVELRRAGGAGEGLSSGSTQECVRSAMEEAQASAEFQARAIGARNDEERVTLYKRAASRGIASGQANFGTS